MPRMLSKFIRRFKTAPKPIRSSANGEAPEWVKQLSFSPKTRQLMAQNKIETEAWEKRLAATEARLHRLNPKSHPLKKQPAR